MESGEKNVSEDLARMRRDIADLRLRLKQSEEKRRALGSNTDRFQKKANQQKEASQQKA